MKSLKDSFFVFVGSAFGLGLLPIAPGSFGALLGVVMHLGILYCFPDSLLCQFFGLAACLVGTALVHFLLNSWAERYYNDTDSGNFVLDEIVGYLVVPIALIGYTKAPWWYIPVAGFLLFRIFDIIKLPVARYIDRNWHNAWGVVLDDVVSALYAAAVVWLLGIYIWG
jgi:phosphatidylglycerophosphatase A